MLLNLFNKKNKPNPIFDVLGVDMHSHLLPGVDDGSKALDESINCLRALAQLGFSRTIITPHFQYPRFQNKEYDIERRYSEFCTQVKQAGVGIELAGIAGEYRIDTGFQARLDNPQFLKVGGRYVLVELSLHHQLMGVDEMLFDMQMKGYDVILAHPERYPYITLSSDRYERMKDAGILFQCNILSLSGFYGPDARQKAITLVDRGWSEFLGTDTHNEIYIKAMIEASHNRTVQRVLQRHQFLNNQL
ncbi:MAG: hypothetical protein K5650_04570 [Bacteroidales bacterium]|nr:hypothetical protein [Bacteroidales bacterium]